eukprot:TRINITY_DN5419_c0_g2_i1.p1 TRINITY_DN5419_c0_g2~~TRINITY_DN5419_c0_g2_i1.p1  ORF type:complete len:458 (+),score=139.05 TRINITY_DN5419_c0_g2_i1:68-1375(+)
MAPRGPARCIALWLLSRCGTAAGPAAAAEEAAQPAADPCPEGSICSAAAWQPAAAAADARGLILALAQGGNAAMQYELGQMHHSGRGAPQDDAEALRWFRLAAAQGYVAAQKQQQQQQQGGASTAGAPPPPGAGDGEDDDMYEISAQYNLGWLALSGKGVEQDEAEALIWFRRAAANAYSVVQRHRRAQRRAGGVGDVETLQQAAAARQRAAESDEAKEEVVRAALGGDAAAQLALGSLARAASDWQGALPWLRLAAAQGLVPAQGELAEIFEIGGDAPLRQWEDKQEAVRLYNLASKQGYAPAQLRLGKLYLSGSGVPKNRARGLGFLRLAAAQGSREARAELAAAGTDDDTTEFGPLPEPRRGSAGGGAAVLRPGKQQADTARFSVGQDVFLLLVVAGLLLCGGLVARRVRAAAGSAEARRGSRGGKKKGKRT